MLKKDIDKALSRIYKSINNKDAIRQSDTYHLQKCNFYALVCDCDCKQCAGIALGMMLQLTWLPYTQDYDIKFVALYDCYLEFVQLYTSDGRIQNYG